MMICLSAHAVPSATKQQGCRFVKSFVQYLGEFIHRYSNAMNRCSYVHAAFTSTVFECSQDKRKKIFVLPLQLVHFQELPLALSIS